MAWAHRRWRGRRPAWPGRPTQLGGRRGLDRARRLVGDERADVPGSSAHPLHADLRRGRITVEHPGVLRPAALARVHDELALGQRDTGEAAGQHPHLVAVVDGERAQVGVPGTHAVFDERRDRRELHDGLGDPAARVLDQPPAQLGERRLRGIGTDDEPLAARAVDGLHDELVEPVEHLGEGLGLLESPGVDVRQHRLLAEVVADELGHVRVHELVVGDAVAHRVGDRDVPEACRQHEPRRAEHGVGAELLRVEELVVDATVDDVDAGGARGRAHPHAAARAEQVASLDELDAHQSREQGVLEVRRVEHAGRQHDDGRVVDAFGRAGAQRLQQLGSGSRRRGARAWT